MYFPERLGSLISEKGVQDPLPFEKGRKNSMLSPRLRLMLSGTAAIPSCPITVTKGS